MTPYADCIYDDYELFEEDPYEEIREVLAPEYADLTFPATLPQVRDLRDFSGRRG